MLRPASGRKRAAKRISLEVWTCFPITLSPLLTTEGSGCDRGCAPGGKSWALGVKGKVVTLEAVQDLGKFTSWLMPCP